MNIHDPKEFARAFSAVDATNEPKEIRRLIDRDADADLLQSKSGQWYTVEGGELKPVEG